MEQAGGDDDEIGRRGQGSCSGGDAGRIGDIEAGGARQAGEAGKAGVGVEQLGKRGADAAGGADDDGMGAGSKAGKQGTGLCCFSPLASGRGREWDLSSETTN